MKRTTGIFLGAWALAVLVASSGCTEENPYANLDPVLPGQCRRGSEVSETFEGFAHPDRLDILVVVDNSGDILQEQQALADALPDFLDTLDERGLSVRLGVVSADATSAPGLAPPGTIRDGCEQNSGAFADSEGAGDWTRVAACNVVQGDTAQPRQQALEVAARSLADMPGDLGEFFRPQARRLVVVLSNEDDCSSSEQLGGDEAVRTACVRSSGRLTKVGELVDKMRDDAITPQAVSLAVFSGPPSERDLDAGEAVRPVCQGSLGASYPANRLWEAAEAFGEQGYFSSLCTDELNFALGEVADRLAGPSRATFCPARRLVHEPLEVTARTGDADGTDVALGESGFLYLGPTAQCDHGAVSLAPEALAGASALDMRYCVDP